MFFDQKNTVHGGMMLLEAVSSLPLCLAGGYQMMPQGIIRNSLGDASRHHQGVKGRFMWYWQKSEAGSSSDDPGVVEIKVGASNTSLSSGGGSDTNIKNKRTGVVGKILKTVKNQTSSGESWYSVKTKHLL